MDFKKKARAMAEAESQRQQAEANKQNAINHTVSELMEGLVDYMPALGPDIGHSGNFVTVRKGDSSLGIAVKAPKSFVVFDGDEPGIESNEDQMMEAVVKWYHKTLKATAQQR